MKEQERPPVFVAGPEDPTLGHHRLDGEAIRRAMGNYPTGVAVVTARNSQGQDLGMVVGTFSSVSLDPPLVSYMPMKSSKTYLAIAECESYAVNILAADQEQLCRDFAMAGPEERFAGLDCTRTPGGSPILPGAVGWIECSPAVTHEAGDHLIVLGQIEALSIERDSLPLLFFQRGYGRFQHGPLMLAETRGVIDAVRLAELGRAEVERVAHDLGVECSLQTCIGEELVIVLSANHAKQRQGSRLGFRAPCVPPLGSLFVDTPDGPALDEWLDRLGPDRATLEPVIREQVERSRNRGWSITLRGDLSDSILDEVVDQYSEAHHTPDQGRALSTVIRQMLANHEPALTSIQGGVDVLQVSVPVIDAAGRTSFALRLSSLPAHATEAQIQVWVTRATSAAQLIGERLIT